MYKITLTLNKKLSMNDGSILAKYYFINSCRVSLSNFSIEYRNIVLGIIVLCSIIKSYSRFGFRLPASRNIQPIALCIKSCL